MRWITALSAAAAIGYAALAQGAETAGEGPLSAGLVNPGYHEPPTWFKVSFLDIREDVEEAAASDRRVMLYFYQDGCPYCALLLEHNFADREISETTQRYFDTIAINMWGDREVTDFDGNLVSEKEFARRMSVMYTPTLLMLNERGEVVLRLNGYLPPHKFRVALEYAGSKREVKGPFNAYLEANSASEASGKLHVKPWYIRPPYRLADTLRDSGRPLLVLFEQKRCSACDELHLDVFQRPETRKLLSQFDIVLLDTWSDDPVQTPQGREVTVREWARELNIAYTPSQVFFDTSRREVFRSEAYLKAFHVQSVLDYVASQAYEEQPEFQRFVEARADALRAQGVDVDLMD
jgi:thioredoxin-related protein